MKLFDSVSVRFQGRSDMDTRYNTDYWDSSMRGVVLSGLCASTSRPEMMRGLFDISCYSVSSVVQLTYLWGIESRTILPCSSQVVMVL